MSNEQSPQMKQMDQFTKNIVETEQKLNDISPSMCMAKWYQVTIHLQNGHTHSCHHPGTHQVPLEELEANPSALHNTLHKKKLREEMVTGVRPKECDYCWRIEDVGERSDRTYKSADSWARSYIPIVEEAKKTGTLMDFANADVNPTYVEVVFDHTCNFKCAYCAPNISSSWMEEIEQHGPYLTAPYFNDLRWIEKQGQMPIPRREENPYVEAFWKWWPSLVPGLHTFRITGGEPILSKNTFRVMDDIIENNPNPNLHLAINSNMCVPDKLFDDFVVKLNRVRNNVQKVTIYTSIDTFIPKHNEYIRFGMEHDKFCASVEKLLDTVEQEITLSFMITISALSVYGTRELVEWIYKMKEKYKGKHRLMPDFPYLRHPEFLCVDINPEDAVVELERALEFVKAKSVSEMSKTWEQEEKDKYAFNWKNYAFFDDFAVQRLGRVIEFARDKIANPNPELKTRMEDFAMYVDEYDYRRGTNFVELFPQMDKFYNRAKTMLIASGRQRNAREGATDATVKTVSIPVSSIKRLNKAKSLFDQ